MIATLHSGISSNTKTTTTATTVTKKERRYKIMQFTVHSEATKMICEDSCQTIFTLDSSILYLLVHRGLRTRSPHNHSSNKNEVSRW